MEPSKFALGGDLEVRRLGFGAMRITGSGVWGEPPDAAAAKKLLHRVIDLGIHLIDTADSYGPEVSERILGEALHPYPEGVVIATKGGLVRPGPGEWVRKGDPAHLRSACEGSLARLKVERIDLYQLHAADPNVPLADQIGTLADLQREGKIRHIGVSNFSVAELEEASTMVNVVSVQNRYNLTDRSSEAVLRACESKGIAFIPWYPLVAGNLEAPRRVAEAAGITPSQVALAWLLQRSPVMLPIPGTSSIEHLEENARADSVAIDPDILAAID